MSIVTQAARGAAWTISTSLISRGMTLVGTLLLVRYLAPEDYGVVCAAALLTSSANAFSTLGIGIYLIAHPRSTKEVSFHATVLNMVLLTVALGLVLLLGNRLGPLFDADGMSRFLPGMALSVLLDRIAFVPERLLIRSMRFRVLSGARASGEAAYTVFAVASAIAGAGGWAIVIGNLARSLTRAVLIIAPVARREWLEPCKLRLRTFAEMAGYGVTISISGLAMFATRRWDNLLVSRYYGPAVMGAYNLAYNLADIPAVQVGEQVQDVLQASFVQMTPEERPEALLRSTAILGLLIFPLAIGLGMVAPTVCETVFSGKWGMVAPMLVLLSVLSVPRPILGALTAYLQARKFQRPLMIADLGLLAVLVAAIKACARTGPLSVCAAVGAVFAARAVVNMFLVRAVDKIPVHQFLDRLAPPLAACAPMAASVLAVRLGLEHAGVHTAAVRLVVEAGVGAAVYVASAFLVAPVVTHDLIEIARRTMSKRRRVEPAPDGASGT